MLKKITKRFYTDENSPDSFIELPVRVGKATIRLNRTEADVLGAKKGNSLACMNSVCIKREAAEGKFPHPVFATIFDTTMCYVIDKITPGRQWKSAVRYRHNDRNGVKIHDRISPAEVIKRGKAVKTVVLSPPLELPARPGQKQTPKLKGPQASHRLVIPMGTRRRAIESGLLIPKAA